MSIATHNTNHNTPHNTANERANAKNALEARLVLAQIIAGALFFVFLVMHLANTLLAVLGADTYNRVQTTLQGVYQQPILEFLLVIGPLLTHTIAGVWLYRLRKKWQARRSLRFRLQTWSGFFLLLVVFGHMLATRGVGWWYGAAPGFDGVAFSLWWVPGYFYPYYFLLFVAGLYHGSTGVVTALRRTGLGSRHSSAAGNNHLLTVSCLGAIGVGLALLSFGGVLFEISDPRDSDYARQYAELFTIDLISE